MSITTEGIGSSVPEPTIRYIAFPKAMKLLTERLGASPEEFAAWIWMGPDAGGLAAFLNINELETPPQFYFNPGVSEDFDYVSPLMGCWFREEDINTFVPVDRYITGKTLIERWSGQPGLKPEAFIRAKIAESRLLDGHPIYGCTQGTSPEDKDFPPLETGLFVLSHVEEIEAEDLGVESTVLAPPLETVDSEIRSSIAPSLKIAEESQIRQALLHPPANTDPEVGSPEWRRQNAIAAADAKHNKPGGSREKRQRIREIWALGKYANRDLCAEQECAHLGMSFSAARAALRNTPDPEQPSSC